MPSPTYTRDILRLAAAIPHLGRLADPQGSAERRAPLCGSRVIADAALDADGRLCALGLEVSACAFGQAAAALMGRESLGRTPQDLAAAAEIIRAWLAGEGEVAPWPGLDALLPARALPARHGAILLPFEAVAEAAAEAAAKALGRASVRAVEEGRDRVQRD